MEKKKTNSDPCLETVYIETMAEAYSSGRWSVHTSGSVDSTQKWVRQRISALSDRSVFIAGSQTEGRGRTGRSWQSPPGGFYASLLLKPAPPIEFAQCVSLLAALAVSRIAGRRGLSAMVKWPNDVIISERKIAGIVAETGCTPESWFILGIGVNLKDAPEVPGRSILPPGALRMFAKPPEPEEFLHEFLKEFDNSWPSRNIHPVRGLMNELHERLWNRGREVVIRIGEEENMGVIKGLDENGSLLLSTNSGDRRLVSGELLTVHGESVGK